VLDGLGHTRLLLDSSGNITDRYSYDAWGNPIEQVGTTFNPFRWNAAYGYEWTPAISLYHVGAREYDPRTARWLQRDPIDASSGDPNLYRYAGNDPINQVDPDGTDCDYRRVLDLAGFIPGIGDVADAINAIGYALEGDWVNAGISAASVVGADWLKAGRLAQRVVQEVVEGSAEQVAKQEAKNALQEQGKKHANRTSGNNPAAQKGQKVHNEFKQEARKRGWDANPKLGSGSRPDAIDECGRPIELKPNTKWGMRRGRKQAQRYADETGREARLIPYDPETGEILWDKEERIKPRR
jgi:RHS repeat-associated protein